MLSSGAKRPRAPPAAPTSTSTGPVVDVHVRARNRQRAALVVSEPERAVNRVRAYVGVEASMERTLLFMQYVREMQRLRRVASPTSSECGELGELVFCVKTKCTYVRRRDIPWQAKAKLGVSPVDIDGNDVFLIDWDKLELLASREVKNYDKTRLTLGEVLGKAARCDDELLTKAKIAEGVYTYSLAISSTTLMSDNDKRLALKYATKYLPPSVAARYAIDVYSIQDVLDDLPPLEDLRAFHAEYTSAIRSRQISNNKFFKPRRWQMRLVDTLRTLPATAVKCDAGACVVTHVLTTATIVTAGTGAGKTIALVNAAVATGARFVLVVCHSSDHYRNYTDVIKAMRPLDTIQCIRTTTETPSRSANWVLTTRFRTQWPDDALPLNHFDLDGVDEFHNIETAARIKEEHNARRQTMKCVDRFSKRHVLMSATPTYDESAAQPCVGAPMPELLADQACCPVEFHRLLVPRGVLGLYYIANSISRGLIKRAMVCGLSGKELDQFGEIVGAVDPTLKIVRRYTTHADELPDPLDTTARYAILTVFKESTGTDIRALDHLYFLNTPRSNASWKLFVQRVGRVVRHMSTKIAHVYIPVHTTGYSFAVHRLLAITAKVWGIDVGSPAMYASLCSAPGKFSSGAAGRQALKLNGGKRMPRARVINDYDALVDYSATMASEKRGKRIKEAIQEMVDECRRRPDDEKKKTEDKKPKKKTAATTPKQEKKGADGLTPSVKELLRLAEVKHMTWKKLKTLSPGQVADVCLRPKGEHSHLDAIVAYLARKFPPSTSTSLVVHDITVPGKRRKMLSAKVSEYAVRNSLAARMLVHGGRGFVVPERVRSNHDLRALVAVANQGYAGYDKVAVSALSDNQPDPSVKYNASIKPNFATATDTEILYWCVATHRVCTKNNTLRERRRIKAKVSVSADDAHHAGINDSNTKFLSQLVAVLILEFVPDQGQHKTCRGMLYQIFKFKSNLPLGVAVARSMMIEESKSEDNDDNLITRLVALHGAHRDTEGNCGFSTESNPCICTWSSSELSTAAAGPFEKRPLKQFKHVMREAPIVFAVRDWVSSSGQAAPPPNLVEMVRDNPYIGRVLVRGVLAKGDAYSALLAAALPDVTKETEEAWDTLRHNVVRRKLFEFAKKPDETPAVALVRLLCIELDVDE